MSNLIFKTIIYLYCTYSVANIMTNVSDNPILQIDFQDFFQGDQVGLKISDCTIIQDSALTSNKSDGFTGLSIKIYEKSDLTIKIKYLQRQINCHLNKKYDGAFALTVILNGVPSQYQIDLSKGNYIGFSKKNQRELYFRQATSRFLYD